jgi:hypothetical protein
MPRQKKNELIFLIDLVLALECEVSGLNLCPETRFILGFPQSLKKNRG